MRRDKKKPSEGRRTAREFAFRVLFEAKQGTTDLSETLERAKIAMRNPEDDSYPELTSETLEFAESLLNFYHAQEESLDFALEQNIKGWSFSQMAQTDLNILRLALTEILFTDTPEGPIIESATRIARKFGGDESGRFVNGVLASLVRAKAAGKLELEPTEEM